MYIMTSMFHVINCIIFVQSYRCILSREMGNDFGTSWVFLREPGNIVNASIDNQPLIIIFIMFFDLVPCITPNDVV